MEERRRGKELKEEGKIQKEEKRRQKRGKERIREVGKRSQKGKYDAKGKRKREEKD